MLINKIKNVIKAHKIIHQRDLRFSNNCYETMNSENTRTKSEEKILAEQKISFQLNISPLYAKVNVSIV